METEVGAVLGVAATTAGTEKTLVDGWLNDGVIDVLLRTRCYVTSSTATETANQGDYTLDTAILAVAALQWSTSGGAYSIPERVSPEEILRLRASNPAVTSTPAQFYAVAGSNLLMVWPLPAGADTITLYTVPRPTAMSSASHDPSNATYGGVPAEYHKAIVLYAKWQAGDYDDDQSSAQGERYRQLYESEIQRIRRYVNGKGSRLQRARRSPLWRRPHDRSTDIW